MTAVRQTDMHSGYVRKTNERIDILSDDASVEIGGVERDTRYLRTS
jgi:hypothetical protein